MENKKQPKPPSGLQKAEQIDDQVTITTNKSGLEKAFDLARKEGFNEALEEALDVLKPYFSIYATTNKVSWLDVIKALDKIKK